MSKIIDHITEVIASKSVFCGPNGSQVYNSKEVAKVVIAALADNQLSNKALAEAYEGAIAQIMGECKTAEKYSCPANWEAALYQIKRIINNLKESKHAT